MDGEASATHKVRPPWGEFVSASHRPSRVPKAGTIHEAAARGDLGSLQRLVSNGPCGDIFDQVASEMANANVPDECGWTALHWAVWERQEKAVEFLLSHGADANARENREKMTPLHMAAMRGNALIATSLIAGRASTDARTTLGDTPLHFAAESGDSVIVAVLLNHGADINVRGFFDRTPLHSANMGNNASTTAYLLSHGADWRARDRLGRTALDYAIRFGDKETIKELQIFSGQHGTSSASR